MEKVFCKHGHPWVEENIRVSPGGRRCRICALTTQRKWRATNRIRYLKGQQAYRSRNKEKIRASARAYKAKKYYFNQYGLSNEVIEKKLLGQENKCLICEKRLPPFNVDHNHETGEIRGFICPSCNKGLGFFRDSPQILGQAIWYLNNN